MNLKPTRRSAVFAAALSSIVMIAGAASGDEPAAPKLDATVPALTAPVTDPHVIYGFGVPSEISKPSFLVPGVIKTISVQRGDIVKKDQEIMAEDTALEQAELATLKVAADNEFPFKEQETVARIKDELLQKMEAAPEGSVSDQEKLPVQLDRDVARVRMDQAKSEREGKQKEYERQLRKIEKMRIVSPVNGVVQEINLGLGSVVDPNKPEGACVIVQNDPLWVKVDLRPSESAKLKMHDKVKVAFPDDPTKWLDAEVVYFDPVVQSGSNTQVVRFSLPNPENRPAGLSMAVKLPDNVFAETPVAAGNP
jgi:multidrug efflux pump subunit AcrA (membrane-fusion protein)